MKILFPSHGSKRLIPQAYTIFFIPQDWVIDNENSVSRATPLSNKEFRSDDGNENSVPKGETAA